MAPPKALDNIGKTLHSQYERWQPKVRNLLSFSNFCGILSFDIDYLHLRVLNLNVTCRLVISFIWIQQWRRLRSFVILAVSMPNQRESFSIIMAMVYQSLQLMERFGCLTR
jgi:hypothetical protein